MATMSIPRASRTATIIPFHTGRVAARQPAGTLAQKIDDLAELRTLIRQATATERQLTGEILTELAARRVTRFEGSQAVAMLEHRTTLSVDPGLFLLATGKAGHAALAVSVTKARELLGEQDLVAISEKSTTPALRLEQRTADPRQVA
jgi:hypothetical protein